MVHEVMIPNITGSLVFNQVLLITIMGSQSGSCRVRERLAGGTAALVEWKLHTGRTHQIRVHAQHIGCPLLGDDSYGGVSRAITMIGRNRKARYCLLAIFEARSPDIFSICVLGERLFSAI
jgi:hypothetical protein